MRELGREKKGSKGYEEVRKGGEGEVRDMRELGSKGYEEVRKGGEGK